MRSLRTLTALAGLALGIGYSAIPTPADTRAPEPREREPRLAPQHFASSYRAVPPVARYVSRQQRRAALRAADFAELRSDPTTARLPRATLRRDVATRTRMRVLDRVTARGGEV